MPRFDLLQSRREEPRESREDRSFEKMVWQKTEFKDIDVQKEGNRYHVDMLRGLIYQSEFGKSSLIRQIFAREDVLGAEIERVIVEAVFAHDISFDIGTKRNVDRFSFRFSNGKELFITVSLDRVAFDRSDDSPSLAEAQALSSTDISVPAFQTCYGSLILPTSEGRKGLICKEYLPGSMLANVTEDIENFIADQGVDAFKKVLEAVAEAFGSTLRIRCGLPVDSHTMNIILFETAEGKITARFCDVEYIRENVQGIQTEVQGIAKAFGAYRRDFLRKFDEIVG